jgi:hypothetical protein
MGRYSRIEISEMVVKVVDGSIESLLAFSEI